MSFAVGQTVVYPNHGAAVIENREEREIDGEKREYLVFTVAEQSLTLRVPADSCEEVGIRAVASAKEVDDVLDLLSTNCKLAAGPWARQYKNNQRRVASGDLTELAEVVRELTTKERHKGSLSAGEMRLRDKAHNMLAGEVAASRKVELEKAERLIADALEATRVIG